MRLSISFVIFSLCLLASPVAVFQAGPSEDQEIAILTIREDNIRARTTAELLPVARHAGGHFELIAVEPIGPQRSCPESRFRGSQKAGAKYDVFLGGLRIGEATARRREIGAYSCSALCVVSAETTVRPNLGGRKDQRFGFDQTDFDESLTQFVALSPSPSRIEFRTVPVDPPSNTVRDSVTRLVTTRFLSIGGEPDAQTKIQLEDLRLFHSTRAGAVHAFVRAGREDANETKVVSAIVNIREGRAAELLLDLVAAGNLDRRAEFYEFVDAIDLNGDGRSELLVIYHNYEFHEFEILELASGGGRYHVIHRGPTYGC